MQVAIAGGHGAIALHLTRALTGAGHDVTSVIRNPDQRADVEAAGARVVIADLESADGSELTAALGSADTVVFAAGAGPGSGAARKETVDHLGAVRLIDAAAEIGAEHYVMISAIGADAEHPGDEVFDDYLRAKGRADDAVRSGPVPFTIVRPTRLTDGPADGVITLGVTAAGGPISRADVAEVVAAIIDRAGPTGRTLELTAGPTPVTEAVAALG
jgi:uncharacterized protein YbjT (DUF2867 family)